MTEEEFYIRLEINLNKYQHCVTICSECYIMKECIINSSGVPLTEKNLKLFLERKLLNYKAKQIINNLKKY